MAPLKWKSEPGSKFHEADVPPKPANDNKPNTGKANALRIVPAFNFNEEDIPLRQWVIPGLLIRKHLSVLVAPPGAGKSLLTLQLGLAIARGEEWGGFNPRGSYRVFAINSEDDIDELRRRLSAAVRTMQIDRSELTDSFYLAENPESIVVAKTDPRTKSVTRLPLVDEIIRIVTDQKIDVFIVDPFAETFDGDENSNSEVKWAAAIWREVARKTNAAVLLVHHVSKALSAAPGDMNAARGGGALVGVARSVVTLFAMSEQDARTMVVPEAERHLYVRFDDAKANLSLVTGKARWFRKETVRLNNGSGHLHGDDVGVLTPWRAPPLMDGMTTEIANAILDDIATGHINDDGEVTGSLYSLNDPQRGLRWAGHVVIKHMAMDAARAGKILREWKKNGVIDTIEFHDPETRKPRKGIKVNDGNRPGREVK